MEREDLFDLAADFRKAIQTVKRNREFYNMRDRMNNFPSGCCDDSADLLGYHLLNKYRIPSKQGNGVYRDDDPYNTTNHAWIVFSDGTIIDITADQFPHFSKCPNGIYIGKPNDFYDNLDDLRICEHYDITQDSRLWHDYQEICKYLNK